MKRLVRLQNEEVGMRYRKVLEIGMRESKPRSKETPEVTILRGANNTLISTLLISFYYESPS